MATEQIVHLDLKGAPPRVAYLQSLFPIMRKWGATGLCIEWEDMFPYSGPLRALRGPYAYSPADIRAILQAAHRSHLKVIPLIQTFGHLEYLLKHPQFASMRERRENLQDLCPSQPQAGSIVAEMLNQVLALHPAIDTIHLGGDEVRALGSCPTCSAYVARHKRAGLYLKHITPLAERMKSRGLRVLLWDDMFRNWPVPALRKLASVAEPVVWSYGADIGAHFPPDMWQRYAKAGLRLWGASAFKGSGGEDISWPTFGERIANHAAWAMRARRTRLEGIILTGWSRHSHFYPLCETMPAALPSLALSLAVLRAGKFSHAMRQRIFTQLGIGDMPFMHRTREDIEAIPLGNFPGAEVFRLIGKLQGARQLLDNCLHFRRVIFPDHNGGRWNVEKIALIVRDGRIAVRVAREVGREIEKPLRRILFPADVAEFMETRVHAVIRGGMAISSEARETLLHSPG